MENVIELITDKDDKKAFENTKRLVFESEMSDKYYNFIPDFASLLSDKKSYIRTRALILICSQSRWDKNGIIKKYLSQMFTLIHDEKPTVVRQSLNAFQEVAAFHPELRNDIKNELDKIDLSKYKDSMTGLIEKDIKELLIIMQF